MKSARLIFLTLLLATITLCSNSCSHSPAPQQAEQQLDRTAAGDRPDLSLPTEPRYTYHEFDMLFVFYKTRGARQ
jgi:hypothetical protein